MDSNVNNVLLDSSDYNRQRLIEHLVDKYRGPTPPYRVSYIFTKDYMVENGFRISNAQEANKEIYKSILDIETCCLCLSSIVFEVRFFAPDAILVCTHFICNKCFLSASQTIGPNLKFKCPLCKVHFFRIAYLCAGCYLPIVPNVQPGLVTMLPGDIIVDKPKFTYSVFKCQMCSRIYGPCCKDMDDRSILCDKCCDKFFVAEDEK